MKQAIQKVMRIVNKARDSMIGTYAAQAAFFFMLSLIPILLLLLTLVQYTPVTKADVMTAVVKIFPATINPFLVSIVNQVYNQSRAIIPVTALVALWSAGRGVLAITSGLNHIYGYKETRNYVFLRVRSSFYTVAFILMILLFLIFSVFGNSISLFIEENFPFMIPMTEFMIQIRTVLSMCMAVIFSVIIYQFLPNTKKKGSVFSKIPGAVVTTVGWLILSFIFSAYLEIFQGFSDMYGSLTTIVLIMLWLYFCMYVLLLGGILNELLYEIRKEKQQELRGQNNS